MKWRWNLIRIPLESHSNPIELPSKFPVNSHWTITNNPLQIPLNYHQKSNFPLNYLRKKNPSQIPLNYHQKSHFPLNYYKQSQSTPIELLQTILFKSHWTTIKSTFPLNYYKKSQSNPIELPSKIPFPHFWWLYRPLPRTTLGSVSAGSPGRRCSAVSICYGFCEEKIGISCRLGDFCRDFRGTLEVFNRIRDLIFFPRVFLDCFGFVGLKMGIYGVWLMAGLNMGRYGLHKIKRISNINPVLRNKSR